MPPRILNSNLGSSSCGAAWPKHRPKLQAWLVCQREHSVHSRAWAGHGMADTDSGQQLCADCLKVDCLSPVPLLQCTQRGFAGLQAFQAADLGAERSAAGSSPCSPGGSAQPSRHGSPTQRPSSPTFRDMFKFQGHFDVPNNEALQRKGQAWTGTSSPSPHGSPDGEGSVEPFSPAGRHQAPPGSPSAEDAGEPVLAAAVTKTGAGLGPDAEPERERPPAHSWTMASTWGETHRHRQLAGVPDWRWSQPLSQGLHAPVKQSMFRQLLCISHCCRRPSAEVAACTPCI